MAAKHSSDAKSRSYRRQLIRNIFKGGSDCLQAHETLDRNSPVISQLFLGGLTAQQFRRQVVLKQNRNQQFQTKPKPTSKLKQHLNSSPRPPKLENTRHVPVQRPVTTTRDSFIKPKHMRDALDFEQKRIPKKPSKKRS